MFNTTCRTKQYIGVTPAILSTTVARGLMQDVMVVHGGQQRDDRTVTETWDLILFEVLLRGWDWTEYTLYWTYACKARMIAKFHTEHPTGAPPGRGWMWLRAFVWCRAGLVMQGACSRHTATSWR